MIIVNCILCSSYDFFLSHQSSKMENIITNLGLSNNDNMFEKILNNPGLQHLAENFFDNLKFEDLDICREINQSSKQILDHQMDNPMFLLRKLRGLSKENQKDWIKVIESVKNAKKEKAISAYLQWNLKKRRKDFPCYSSPAVQDDFRKRIMKICEKCWQLSDEDMEIVKFLAPLIRQS